MVEAQTNRIEELLKSSSFIQVVNVAFEVVLNESEHKHPHLVDQVGNGGI
jgi:hypothetical protein